MPSINRRKALQFSLLASSASSVFASTPAGEEKALRERAPINPLTPPADSSIPVAFLLSEGAVVIDFTGPWEVFERVRKPKGTYDAFRLYTVAETSNPIRTSGGMKIVPDYTIENAPLPKVIVIPAQSPASDKTKEWIRKASKHTDVKDRSALWQVRNDASWSLCRFGRPLSRYRRSAWCSLRGSW